MKSQKNLAFMLVLLVVGMGSALAHGGRGRVGVYFGPVWGPAFYSSPFYYSPPLVVAPAAPPPVYIEQHQAPVEVAPAASQQYWHYCNSSKGYYPYVKECPDGWQKVLPQPAR